MSHATSDRSPFPSGAPARGFTLLEALVAVAVFAMVVGIVLTMFSGFGKATNTESGEIDMQQAARISIDELARLIQQAGYGIRRDDPYNPASWQRDVVFAGPHAFAFNADVDSAVGALASSQTITLPGGDTYTGQGTSSSTSGAETYVYSIDANADNSITLADRTDAASGSFNPAAETANPLDFALIRRVFGYNGTDFGGAVSPVSAHLFTNATSAVQYPDGTTPEPLFTYLMTEDLNDDGVLDGTECVVGTCPPSTTRSPQLYVWGDTDFDGLLSESEKTALRTMPVGSPSWSKNRLASGGAYKSSTLSQAVNPSGTDPYILRVADASKFAVGAFVQLGTGSSMELFQVDKVTTSGNTVSLATDPKYAHASGETVAIVPQTFLRAVRSVQVNFQAISPRKDSDGGSAAAGRMGRKGTRGLDYRVTPLRASVELRNLSTHALIGSNSVTSTPTCPVTITADCAGTTISQVPAYFPTTLPTTLVFLVKDSGGTPMNGVPLTFSHSSPSLGSLAVTTGKTDSSGKFQLGFTPASTIGDDVVTATATCANASSQLQTYSTTVTVKVSRVNLAVGNDCLSTALSGVPRSTTWSASVQNSSGTAVNVPLLLDLAFDPASLPVTPNYPDYEAELVVGASSSGTTDSAGEFTPVTVSTGSTGTVTGTVRLNRDTPADGLRLSLLATPSGGSCSSGGSPTAKSVSFYSFELDSYTPGTGCTELAPCTIPSGTAAPTVKARLALNTAPLVGATVNFSKIDVHLANPSGSSILNPTSVVTDANGEAKTTVGNDGTGTITAANPLETTVDASSNGGTSCAAGDLQYDGIRPAFRMEGYAGECGADMQQAWLKKAGANDKLCTHVKNTNSPGGCPVKPVGLAVTVYKTDGVTPDANYKLDVIEGGAISTTTDCSTTPKLRLFEAKCKSDLPLNNGQRWDFANVATCVAPTAFPSSGEYFVLSKLDFSGNLVGTGRKIDITIHYRCTGICPAVNFSKTFRLTSPAS